MILDGQNFFSALSSGDSPVLVADNASAYVIDQQVKGGLFTGPGGAYRALWLYAKVDTAFTSNGSLTIAAVLQDSPDNVTWTDQIVGPAVAKASAVANAVLLRVRISPSMARYLRIVWRIGTAAATAGVAIAFLTMDTDFIDLSQRKAEPVTVAEPSGAEDESQNQGVLEQ